MLRRFAALLLAILFSANGLCLTGNELMIVCNQAKNFEDNDFNPVYNSGQYVNLFSVSKCLGYIEAVADYNEENIETHTQTKFTFCNSDTVSEGQAIRVILSYLNNNSKYLDLPANLLIISALTDAYPCKN